MRFVALLATLAVVGWMAAHTLGGATHAHGQERSAVDAARHAVDLTQTTPVATP
jgi:hypothetical protein